MALTPQLPSGPVACWSCGRMIDAADAYCRFCGNGQGGRVPWYYRHFGIILSTLFGLGPFSLYLVWKSPLFSRRTKMIYVVLILGVTGYVGYRSYVFYVNVMNLAHTYRQALGV
ncbi:MAG: hypothetical protein HY059_18530 [Proteobacteria bacterium]|nr:hypothetical protein [Pseudomonadota bacterium]